MEAVPVAKSKMKRKRAPKSVLKLPDLEQSKSASILPLAIMLATTSMFGQSRTQPPRIDPSKCPVGLEVEQNGSPVAYKNGDPTETRLCALKYGRMSNTQSQLDVRMRGLLRPRLQLLECGPEPFTVWLLNPVLSELIGR